MSQLSVSGQALFAAMLVMLATLAARLVVWLPLRWLHRCLPWLQAGAAGLLLGDALLHMLPEAVEHGLGPGVVGECLVIGMLGLLGVECVIRSLASTSSAAPFARMDVLGDVLHHLVDGIMVGAAFVVAAPLGVAVTLAVMIHELPREAGHAGVLVAGGYAPTRAFGLSLVASLAVPVGAFGMTVSGNAPNVIGAGLALAAGATCYLALGDLLPGLWPRLAHRHRFVPILGVSAGVLFMWLVRWAEG